MLVNDGNMIFQVSKATFLKYLSYICDGGGDTDLQEFGGKFIGKLDFDLTKMDFSDLKKLERDMRE